MKKLYPYLFEFMKVDEATNKVVITKAVVYTADTVLPEGISTFFSAVKISPLVADNAGKLHLRE